jgi:hypothetical protein
MKKITLLLLFASLLFSCKARQTRTLINDGNYDEAISKSVSSLRNNKTSKAKQEYIYLLEEAFVKANERDLRYISVWFKDQNPRNLEKIYDTYLALNNRQELVRPLLPLAFIKENRNARFDFADYSDQIFSSKNALAKHLYENSKALLATNDKNSFRRAYDDLIYLNELSSNFKDITTLIQNAKNKGTDYVFVSLKNQTNVVIPIRLENDLLNFSTYGLNDKWTVYEASKETNNSYDFGIVVNFRDILISPEQIKEKEFYKERQIKDGVKNLVDSNGVIVKDSLGKPIKVDNFKTISATAYEFRQLKSSRVTASVEYLNLQTKQQIQSFPLVSEFIFDYMYAKYRGDKRAFEENYYSNFEKRPQAFPSNEQMVFDASQDLKQQLKSIIVNNNVTRN